MADDDQFDNIVKNSPRYLNQTINMKIIHMLQNLQKSIVSCLYKEHYFWRGMLLQNFL